MILIRWLSRSNDFRDRIETTSTQVFQACIQPAGFDTPSATQPAGLVSR